MICENEHITELTHRFYEKSISFSEKCELLEHCRSCTLHRELLESLAHAYRLIEKSTDIIGFGSDAYRESKIPIELLIEFTEPDTELDDETMTRLADTIEHDPELKYDVEILRKMNSAFHVEYKPKSKMRTSSKKELMENINREIEQRKLIKEDATSLELLEKEFREKVPKKKKAVKRTKAKPPIIKDEE